MDLCRINEHFYGFCFFLGGQPVPKFIMASSEDEFMPIFIAASAAFVANNPKHLPAGNII